MRAGSSIAQATSPLVTRKKKASAIPVEKTLDDKMEEEQQNRQNRWTANAAKNNVTHKFEKN